MAESDSKEDNDDPSAPKGTREHAVGLEKDDQKRSPSTLKTHGDAGEQLQDGPPNGNDRSNAEHKQVNAPSNDGSDTTVAQNASTATTILAKEQPPAAHVKESQSSIDGRHVAAPSESQLSDSKVQSSQLGSKKDRKISVGERDGDTSDPEDQSKGGSMPSASAASQQGGPADHTPSDSVQEPAQTSSNHKQSVSDAFLRGNTGAVSQWSHQALAPTNVDSEEKKAEEEWQTMPAYAPFDLYDDDNRLVAREAPASDEEANAYHGLGGAGKGYTRVQADEDAQSATSMDDNTNYLFKSKGTDLIDDEEGRDPLAQLQATKDLLTDGQKIAYVGLTRLAWAEMIKELEDRASTKATKKIIALVAENSRMWGQQIMIRLYMHMDIDASEQVMIEQLAEHGVVPSDLTPVLMQNARVKNPMAKEEETQSVPEQSTEDTDTSKECSQSPGKDDKEKDVPSIVRQDSDKDDAEAESLPPYTERAGDSIPRSQTPTQLGTGQNIDIDLRWTVLCDLFLVLLSDSIYDARSRSLLERVGESLQVTWVDICRFEKRVTDALEMEEEASKETWDEAEHLENRRKRALRRRYMMMGLATAGGSLVIGLSAGLLAPVIGAGLAAGFTTIGVAGTSGFLAGAGGAAIITSTGVLTGGAIAVKASHRRTGAVTTFEYRPLHNNKRVNLILTVSGWMNGKVDDVRLPFSTINPVMGDIYSLLWEPEMLQSMGQTINILASEALSQTVQQVLGSTVLIALMSALQLPIVLTKLSYLIDNPWTVSMARANLAGLILADSLIDRNLGMRPITLVGFSLGARVIFAALRELASRGAFGLIQNVYLFGSPIVANKDEYMRCRTVISGRFVNGYASNDWILGYLFRATSGGIMRVSGLAKVENIPGLENYDVTKLVNGHMAYRAAMPRLLREVGWEVDSDEFTEIEDPDPENHEQRQREMIDELEEARKNAAEEKPKSRFNFFKRNKGAPKKKWELYDESSKESATDDFSTTAAEGSGNNVLFDIEAIKRELESEAIQVRQLESTMPPMKLNPEASHAEKGFNPHLTLRETKSYDETAAKKESVPGAQASSTSLTNGAVQQHDNPFNKGYDEYNLSAEAMDGKPSSEKSKITSGKQEPAPSPKPEPQPSTPPQRPSLRTSMSSPASTAEFDSLDHNAWIDEDDPEFGKEKDVQLTF